MTKIIMNRKSIKKSKILKIKLWIIKKNFRKPRVDNFGKKILQAIYLLQLIKKIVNKIIYYFFFLLFI